MLVQIDPISIKTTQKVAEIAWFDDLCGGDTEYLSVKDPQRQSTYEHCRDIMLKADELGYSNILLPNSYVEGQDPLVFAGALAPQTKHINMLVAIRVSELHPPMLARSIATLDHILKGRLTINIINSDLPGLEESADIRYKRCEEVIEILKQTWQKDQIEVEGDFYTLDLPSAPAKPFQKAPLLYFGGIADGAKEVCAKYCDVFLMWPETEESLYATMQDVSQRAAKYDRKIDFGLRIHVIVRETEAEARAYAKRLMSKFNEQQAQAMKYRTQDGKSLGVVRQDELRQTADEDGFVEPLLWTEIGKARSGCGGALVGSPAQILEKLHRYMDMGIRAFVLSGYPLIEESELFAQYVLPHLPNVKLSEVYQKD
ncbi:MAG: LLM class flavin-dependent oxidoreductase [Microscillaceae bacterium]|nr:LLM class flavin-dependent oxidoreductase [Microscillaceae bacterium]